MTVTINGSGTITGISAGGLPDAIITQADLATGVAGTGPAFSAYVGSSQTIVTNTFVKMQINTEEFDTNNNFDPTTNYRFTPTVAGYYQVNGSIVFSTNITSPQLAIYKNGTNFKVGTNYASGAWANVSALVYLNGSTDYIELYGAHVTGTTQSLNIASNYNYFQASMVRGA
jgi:hypothetical protein